MRDSSEYWVLNGERTYDAFANDCLDWYFSKQDDESYSIRTFSAPFFSDEYWNYGYLSMRTDNVDGSGNYYQFSISTELETTWILSDENPLDEEGEEGAGGYTMEAK